MYIYVLYICVHVYIVKVQDLSRVAMIVYSVPIFPGPSFLSPFSSPSTPPPHSRTLHPSLFSSLSLFLPPFLGIHVSPHLSRLRSPPLPPAQSSLSPTAPRASPPYYIYPYMGLACGESMGTPISVPIPHTHSERVSPVSYDAGHDVDVRSDEEFCHAHATSRRGGVPHAHTHTLSSPFSLSLSLLSLSLSLSLSFSLSFSSFFSLSFSYR